VLKNVRDYNEILENSLALKVNKFDLITQIEKQIKHFQMILKGRSNEIKFNHSQLPEQFYTDK
jgi:hypothetical protein